MGKRSILFFYEAKRGLDFLTFRVIVSVLLKSLSLQETETDLKCHF